MSELPRPKDELVKLIKKREADEQSARDLEFEKAAALRDCEHSSCAARLRLKKARPCS